MTANAQHSRESVEWYTPRALVESARTALGPIDLDPSSCEEANDVVQARAFYANGGDVAAWGGAVFVNPPGGLVSSFWSRLVSEHDRAGILHAIWVGFSLEQLQTLQKHARCPLHFPTCITRKRVPYTRPNGLPARSPTHSSYVTYVPGTLNASAFFRREFATWGIVL